MNAAWVLSFILFFDDQTLSDITLTKSYGCLEEFGSVFFQISSASETNSTVVERLSYSEERLIYA